MFKKEATKLFKNGKRSRSVLDFFEKESREAREKNDSIKSAQLCSMIQSKTITLFALSLEAASLLNLPKEGFHDLYEKGLVINPANLLRGMHTKGMIKVIEHAGYSVQIEKLTDDICKVVYTLDNGIEGRYVLTIEEAEGYPYIRDELSNEESLWYQKPKEMLRHEAVRFVAKTFYKRLFTVKATELVATFKNNRKLAEEIFYAKLYDIEIDDFNYRENMEKLKNRPAQLRAYTTLLKKRCIEKIHASLKLCEILGLPKELYYDIYKKSVFPRKTPLLEVRGSRILDVLRELGHMIQVEEATSKYCTLKFEKDGIVRREQVLLDTVKTVKTSVDTELKDPESVWSNHTNTMLMYEALIKVIRTDFSESYRRADSSTKKTMDDLLFSRDDESATTSRDALFDRDEDDDNDNDLDSLYGVDDKTPILEEKEEKKPVSGFIIPDLSRLKMKPQRA